MSAFCSQALASTLYVLYSISVNALKAIHQRVYSKALLLIHKKRKEEKSALNSGESRLSHLSHSLSSLFFKKLYLDLQTHTNIYILMDNLC